MGKVPSCKGKTKLPRARRPPLARRGWGRDTPAAARRPQYRRTRAVVIGAQGPSLGGVCSLCRSTGFCTWRRADEHVSESHTIGEPADVDIAWSRYQYERQRVEEHQGPRKEELCDQAWAVQFTELQLRKLPAACCLPARRPVDGATLTRCVCFRCLCQCPCAVIWELFFPVGIIALFAYLKTLEPDSVTLPAGWQHRTGDSDDSQGPYIPVPFTSAFDPYSGRKAVSSTSASNFMSSVLLPLHLRPKYKLALAAQNAAGELCAPRPDRCAAARSVI